MARPNKFRNVKYGKNQNNAVGVIPQFVIKVLAFCRSVIRRPTGSLCAVDWFLKRVVP